ncbi:GNAT family N-acetyltransferase [Microbacterium aurum]
MEVAWSLEDRLPTPGEHRRLAEAVGWGESFDWDTLPASLDGSTLGVVAISGERAIGMGRVVGDGVKYFAIQDLVIDPEFQRAGIGRALLDRLLWLIADRAPSAASVTLFASEAGETLYEAAGFQRSDMVGMFQNVEPRT